MEEKLLRTIYNRGMACVKVGQSKSEVFHVHKGARQGCTLSPWLFNVFIDEVAREAKQDFTSGVKLSTGELEVLLFEDDMVVLADSAERLESNLKAMSEVLSRWELKVNWKTKVTRVARQKGHCEVSIGDVEIQQVDEMKYLWGNDQQQRECGEGS